MLQFVELLIQLIQNLPLLDLTPKNHSGFWYQEFDLRKHKILRGGQLIVDFDGAHNCRLHIWKMKAMNFQEDYPSFPIDKLKITMN